MKKINTALFCIFVLLFCSCDVLNKAPLDDSERKPISPRAGIVNSRRK